jgi:hypothetical protein
MQPRCTGLTTGRNHQLAFLRVQVRAELVQAVTRPFLALGVGVQAVEEGALLGQHQAGTAGDLAELDRQQRNGGPSVIDAHVVRCDDPLVIDDVLVDGVIAELPSAGQHALEAC